MTDRELHEKIAEELNIPLERVIAYDNFHWRQLKIDLNNPTFAVMEIPHLGTFTITRNKLYRTLYGRLTSLKNLRKKIQRAKRNPFKLIKKFEAEKEQFSNLWKLRNQMIENRYEEIERHLRYVEKRRQQP